MAEERRIQRRTCDRAQDWHRLQREFLGQRHAEPAGNVGQQHGDRPALHDEARREVASLRLATALLPGVQSEHLQAGGPRVRVAQIFPLLHGDPGDFTHDGQAGDRGIRHEPAHTDEATHGTRQEDQRPS